MRNEAGAPATRPFAHFFASPHQRPGEEHQPVSLEGSGCWWKDPAAIPLAAGRGFNVEAVGELQFQYEIGSIVGGHCEAGHNCEMPAELVPAPQPRDPGAVGIRLDGLPVGYLPAAAAEQIRPFLSDLGGRGKTISCKAKVVGGWDRGGGDRGFFGVRLSLALPPRIHPAARG